MGLTGGCLGHEQLTFMNGVMLVIKGFEADLLSDHIMLSAMSPGGTPGSWTSQPEQSYTQYISVQYKLPEAEVFCHSSIERTVMIHFGCQLAGI